MPTPGIAKVSKAPKDQQEQSREIVSRQQGGVPTTSNEILDVLKSKISKYTLSLSDLNVIDSNSESECMFNQAVTWTNSVLKSLETRCKYIFSFFNQYFVHQSNHRMYVEIYKIIFVPSHGRQSKVQGAKQQQTRCKIKTIQNYILHSKATFDRINKIPIRKLTHNRPLCSHRSLKLECSATLNTWSNQRRKRRNERRLHDMADDSNNYESVEAKRRKIDRSPEVTLASFITTFVAAFETEISLFRLLRRVASYGMDIKSPTLKFLIYSKICRHLLSSVTFFEDHNDRITFDSIQCDRESLQKELIFDVLLKQDNTDLDHHVALEFSFVSGPSVDLLHQIVQYFKNYHRQRARPQYSETQYSETQNSEVSLQRSLNTAKSQCGDSEKSESQQRTLKISMHWTKMDTYVVIQLDDVKFRTSVALKTTDPTWNEDCEL
uniref:C2 domain-containing protein n=1 Tax=Romanomermis culicivorax TaxID=13658 RepID=A0A915JAD9_ROMCU